MDCEIKFFPVPSKINQFYLFGNTKTRIITIKDDKITQKPIDKHERDFYLKSDPVLKENGELMVLGTNNILMFNL